jgi:hypothetical protein
MQQDIGDTVLRNSQSVVGNVAGSVYFAEGPEASERNFSRIFVKSKAITDGSLISSRQSTCGMPRRSLLDRSQHRPRQDHPREGKSENRHLRVDYEEPKLSILAQR